MRKWLVLAFLLVCARGEAQQTTTQLKSVSAQPMVDYCALAQLPAASCAPGINFSVAADCPAGYRAAATSCFMSSLFAPLTINAARESRGVCDWFIGHIPTPDVSAQITLLCVRGGAVRVFGTRKP